MISQKLAKKLIVKAKTLYEIPAADKKHFSFILDGNKIISVGWNFANKTHPLAQKFGYKYARIHSELNAIKNFPYPVSALREFKLVNIRLNFEKKLRISKPCKYCQVLLAFFEIREVYYSTNDGFEEFK